MQSGSCVFVRYELKDFWAASCDSGHLQPVCVFQAVS